jgi:tRNA threonylcarbamoyladenosine biosynthesis protein TsaB
MTILALEFSSQRRSVALADGTRGTRPAESEIFEAVEETGGRGTNVFGLVENVLAAANVSRDEIEVIAVGLGPGSYTGVRAAIAVAQGWELARGVKLLGVSSVESLAAQAQAEKIFGRVNLVLDAQREEFYLAEWEISAARRAEIAALKIVPAAEIAARLAAGEICAGPEMTQALFPSAAAVARLAAGRTDFLPGEKLEPVYLRATNFVKAPAGRGF